MAELEDMTDTYVEEIVRQGRLQEGLEGAFSVTKYVIAVEVESVDDDRSVQVLSGAHTSSWDMYGLARVIEMDAEGAHTIGD